MQAEACYQHVLTEGSATHLVRRSDGWPSLLDAEQWGIHGAAAVCKIVEAWSTDRRQGCALLDGLTEENKIGLQ